MSRPLTLPFLIAAVTLLTVFQIDMSAQSIQGSGSRPRKDLIEVQISVKPSLVLRTIRLDINQSTVPKRIDYRSEHFFSEVSEAVGCTDDCPFYYDSSVFAAAYRKKSDSVDLVIQLRYPKKTGCNINETIAVSRKSEATVKRKCDIEIVARFVNVEKEFGDL